MIVVNMRIAKSVNEFWFQVANLRNHHRVAQEAILKGTPKKMSALRWYN
jgi:hypothetical protein